MTWWQAVLLVAGGLFAGGVNAMAGGGSTLTVPLLVLAGVPGNAANGSNRVGILTSNAAAAASFRRLGVNGLAHIGPVIVPVVAGSLVGSIAIGRLTDDAFETLFGFLMIPLIILSIRKPQVRNDGRAWSQGVTMAVFFGVGLYGGAVQAGLGLVMLAALTRSGYDLVTANHIKVIVNFVITAVALPVFLLRGEVRWIPALLLAVGLTAGGWLGARMAVQGGDRLIRVVMVLATIALAGRLLGLY
ncbi:MAG: sulfite exporter TauE/SafE family protein [Acidimicrobiales bacterium]